MRQDRARAAALAERLCRPQRVGVFGHRGVGKTTLLTVLYREAVGGRLGELRLAAADARTADYLSDKVLQLEAGQPLPATLGETELRFHLYHRGARLDLLVMDYQGEHVAVGRQEPIRDFLRECDAVWLCLDVPVADAAETRLRAQQEVEQLVEDYLSAEDASAPQRPMALVLTKADLLGDAEKALDELADRRFDMTRHALRLHSPQHGLFAVSSLGGPIEGAAGPGGFTPKPAGLEGPLAWLAGVLQTQDEARLEQIWKLAPRDLRLLERCVYCFARRYPDAPATKTFIQRLTALRRRRVLHRTVAGVAAALAVLLGGWSYDAFGESQARRFADANANDPAAVRERWQSYQAWHPTRNWLRPATARRERDGMLQLDAEIRERQREERLAELRRAAADPDADPEAVWQQFQGFRADFPEHDVDPDWDHFRAALKGRRDAAQEKRARLAFEELERRERQVNLQDLVEQADRFLRDHAGTTFEAKVRARRAAYLTSLDERDIEEARAYSAAQPLHFHTRREHYQHYLERHPDGRFAQEAKDALKAIDVDWDKHDFRAVRDAYQARPGAVKEVEGLCRSYLAVHPHGRFRDTATELLRWGERVTAVGEYRVVLRSGQFDNKAAAFFSRGPSMSVEIEVNGVRYGPSNIVKRRYDPDWNYEFPRRVRWKLGDTVRIRVTDNYYWSRHVADFASADGDPLAMRMLSGEVHSGNNMLTFESDFRMPVMPKIE
jgi:GTPase SAR1 family protein